MTRQAHDQVFSVQCPVSGVLHSIPDPHPHPASSSPSSLPTQPATHATHLPPASRRCLPTSPRPHSYLFTQFSSTDTSATIFLAFNSPEPVRTKPNKGPPKHPIPFLSFKTSFFGRPSDAAATLAPSRTPSSHDLTHDRTDDNRIKTVLRPAVPNRKFLRPATTILCGFTPVYDDKTTRRQYRSYQRVIYQDSHQALSPLHPAPRF